MAEFNFLWATLVALFSSFVPGFLLAYPLLRKTSLRLFEIGIFGLVVGFFVPPAMLFFESFVGIGFSTGLVVANIAVLSLIGLALIFREGVPKGGFSFSLDLDEISGKIDLFKNRENLVMLSLLVIFIFAYWVRITGFVENPYFHSPDPYSYLVTAKFILTDGSVPISDDLAWFPKIASHRERPLMQYMLASWYALSGGPGEFDHLFLLNIANIYSSLFGAIVCLMLFILLSRYVGDWFGLFGALQGTLLPITIVAVAWGPEQVPWAILAMLSFFTSYVLLNKEGRWEYAALAAILMLGVALGSKADIFVYWVLGAFIAFQGTVLLFTKKLDRNFFIYNGAIAGVGILSLLAYNQYMYREGALTPVVILGGVVAYLGVLLGLRGFAPSISRQNILTAAMGLVIVLVVAFLSPLGAIATGYVESVLGTTSLFSTIAEQQAISPSEYVLALGPVGAGIFDVKIIDFVIVIFLLLVAFDFAYRGAESAILLAIMVLPLYLLFSSDLKFVTYLGVMAAIALTFCVGSIYKLAGEMKTETEKEKNALGMFSIAGYVIAILAGVLVFYQSVSVAYDLSPFLFASPDEFGEKCSALSPDSIISQKVFCNKIPGNWLETLKWMRENTDKDGAFLAWWDYGHWINYIGERKAVLRNDLAQQDMIRDFAYLLAGNDTESLKQYAGFEEAGKRRAEYLLLDQELVSKWPAISYLSCLKVGESKEHFSALPEERSECERELEFELFTDPGRISISDYCPGDEPTHARVITSKSKTYCIPTQIYAKAEVFDKEMKNPMNVSFFVINTVRGGFLTTAYVFLYEEDDVEKVGSPYDSVFYSGWNLGKLGGFRMIYPLNQTESTPPSIAIYELN